MVQSDESSGGNLKEDVNRPCVVCGASSVDLPIFTMRFPDQKYPGDFVLRKCNGCGVIYNSPRLTGEALARLYEENYYLFLERPADALNRVAGLYNVTLRELLRISKSDPSEVLEVGCAKGYLLALLRENGWKVRGVELSEFASKSARESLGLDVFTGTLEEFVARESGNLFPVVYTTDVIEHVPDPKVFVKSLCKLVQKDGWLLISTPNASAAGIGENGPQWGGFNPFHIWCFTKENIARLLADEGFEVVEAFTYGNLAPSCRESLSSPKARLRRMIPRTLLNLIRNAKYRAVDALSGDNKPVRTLVGEFGRDLDRRTPFLQTDDGRAASEKKCIGENLVIIGRRMR